MRRRFVTCVFLALNVSFVAGCNHGNAAGTPGGNRATRGGLIIPGAPPPKLVYGEGNSSHNFGKLSQQTVGNHIFEVTNDGPGDLRIRLANTTCGCTSVRFADVEWKPIESKLPPQNIVVVPVGDKLEVELIWATEMRVGQFQTAAEFESNDPRDPTPKFSVQGEILPFVESTQTAINLVNPRNSEMTTTSFLVFSKIKEDLEITEITPSHDKLKAQVEPASAEVLESLGALRAFRCTVNVESGVPIGPFNATLVLHTNCAEQPGLDITVRGEFAGDVLVNPQKLDFGHVSAGESKTLGVLINVRSDEDVEVKVKRVVPPFLKHEITRIANSKNRFRLQVTVPPDAAGGEFQKSGIELETNHPGCESVKIPIRGTVAAGLDPAARVTGQ